MLVTSLCTKRTRGAVKEALGVDPLTSPPLEANILDYSLFEGHDVWYIRLHGHAQIKDVWYGEEVPGAWVPALSSEDIRSMDLTKTLVIAGTCYGLESDFPPSFMAAGAKGFIGGYGFNYASTEERVIGPDRLAAWTIRALKMGASVPLAFWLAKAVTLFSAWRGADRDALGFQLIL